MFNKSIRLLFPYKVITPKGGQPPQAVEQQPAAATLKLFRKKRIGYYQTEHRWDMGSRCEAIDISNREELLQHLAEGRLDGLVMPVHNTREDSLELLKELRLHNAQSPIIIFINRPVNRQELITFLRYKANGFVSDLSPSSEVETLLDRVLSINPTPLEKSVS